MHIEQTPPKKVEDFVGGEPAVDPIDPGTIMIRCDGPPEEGRFCQLTDGAIRSFALTDELVPSEAKVVRPY